MIRNIIFKKNIELMNRACLTSVKPRYIRLQPNLINFNHYSSNSLKPEYKTDPNKYLGDKEQINEKGFMDKFKELFYFYKNGIKLIFKNRKEASLLKAKQNQGEVLTRREFQLIYNSGKDMKKLIPFGLLLLILPESIPFVLVFAPQFVPSTCITEEQMLKKRKKIQEKRDNITEFALKSTRNNQQLLTQKNFTQIENVANALANYHRSFEFNFIQKKALQGYLKFMGISSFGPLSLLQRRVSQHFDYLKQDDQYLIKEGVEGLNEKELILALEERGLRTLELNTTQMKNSLNFWLSAHQLSNPSPPPIFLILMNIFRNNVSPQKQ
ncbi:hypothetical protein K502DRAFT_340106 [Neoconidiobolus thromboides FSU 785]|nr:hypothetical protein K502DRAFT_340106 [Neoconidiobolus thromboides FSU 785]